MNSHEARGLVQCVWGAQKSREQGGGGRRGGSSREQKNHTLATSTKDGGNYDTNLYRIVRSR